MWRLNERQKQLIDMLLAYSQTGPTTIGLESDAHRESIDAASSLKLKELADLVASVSSDKGRDQSLLAATRLIGSNLYSLNSGR